jgi:transposase
MTIQLDFTPELITEIRYQRYNHLVPLVQRRMETLLLKAHNLSHAQIEEIVGVTGNTIREYFELYKQGGIEKLKEINYYKCEGELVKHIVSWEAYFRNHPPASIKEAQKEIEEITGVKRSETQVREFLKKTQSPLPKSRHCLPKPTQKSRKSFWNKRYSLA